MRHNLPGLIILLSSWLLASLGVAALAPGSSVFAILAAGFILALLLCLPLTLLAVAIYRPLSALVFAINNRHRFQPRR